jgi:hypothetical protein
VNDQAEAVGSATDVRRRVWTARCVKAATSPWRIVLARLLIERVAATNLRRLDQRKFERLASAFGWLIYDEWPPFAGMVVRPEEEIAALWDRRRRHARHFPRQELLDAYMRVREEGCRRVDRNNRQLWRREYPDLIAAPKPGPRVAPSRAMRPRTGRASRRVVRVARRQRLSLARAGDDPEPAGRARGPARARPEHLAAREAAA